MNLKQRRDNGQYSLNVLVKFEVTYREIEASTLKWLLLGWKVNLSKSIMLKDTRALLAKHGEGWLEGLLYYVNLRETDNFSLMDCLKRARYLTSQVFPDLYENVDMNDFSAYDLLAEHCKTLEKLENKTVQSSVPSLKEKHNE